ncbi:alpha-amylase family glycosyl hydrolase [Zobellella denitrificans]
MSDILSSSLPRNATLYRVDSTHFFDGDGDGQGDLAGVLQQLDYFIRLGVDGLVLNQDDRHGVSTQYWQRFAARLQQAGLSLWLAENRHCRAWPEGDILPLCTLVDHGPIGLTHWLEGRAHGGQAVWATGGPDLTRVVSRFGGGDLKVALPYLALLACLPGPISLWQGEELGLPHAAEPADTRGNRSPLPWVEYPEQSPAAQQTMQRRVAAEHRAMAVNRQEQEPESALNQCRRLLRWRRRQPLVANGRIDATGLHDGLLWVRLAGAQPSLTVILNLLPYRQHHRLGPQPGGWQTELSLGQAELSDDHQLSLGGFSAAIVMPRRQE